MRLLLNLIWLVLAGWWLAICYLIATVLMAITIIGLPFAKQSLKLAGYALWPFGRTLIPAQSRHKKLSVFANILWFVLAGWWLALAHLVARMPAFQSTSVPQQSKVAQRSTPELYRRPERA